MSNGGGADLEAFKNCYHQSGTPRLRVKETFEDGLYKLYLEQKIPDSVDGKKQKAYYYPLKIALIDIDFDEIYDAKDKLLQNIAQKFETKLLAIYRENHFPKSISLEAEDIAKRAIKNRALKILSELKKDEVAQLAQKQYEESLTMTDRIVALDVLENLPVSYAEIALQDFYNKYKEETLVMNKYFAILASSSRYDVLDRVEELQRDEVYDEKVPNLVRSLIGSFSRNHKYFHAKDGSGYKFLVDKIVEIDAINPQMASGLAGAFKIYPKMKKENRESIKKELERILATEALSKNVYEIISKVLSTQL